MIEVGHSEVAFDFHGRAQCPVADRVVFVFVIGREVVVAVAVRPIFVCCCCFVVFRLLLAVPDLFFSPTVFEDLHMAFVLRAVCSHRISGEDLDYNS